jgi:magnesium transporter
VSNLHKTISLDETTFKDKNKAKDFLHYPKDSAGSIMQIEIVKVFESSVIKDVLIKLKGFIRNKIKFLIIWVINDKNKLVGYINLVDLLFIKSNIIVKDVMKKNCVVIDPYIDRIKIIKIFRKYRLDTLPVIDYNDRFLGCIILNDLITLDNKKSKYIVDKNNSNETFYYQKIFQTICLRLPSLSVAFLTSLTSAFIVYNFEDVFQQALYIFAVIPIISAMGGSTGLQSATILMKGITCGKITYRDLPKILLQEIKICFLVGLLVGTALSFIALFILQPYDYLFALIVFVSMLLELMLAAIIGVMAPFLLNKCKFDPTITSAPFLQTTLDITSSLIFLSGALLLLKKVS